jgi:hypothetical protein
VYFAGHNPVNRDAFELLRNTTDPRPFEQYEHGEAPAGVEPDGGAYDTVVCHKALGVSFLDFYDPFKDLFASTLSQQNAGEGQDGASRNND